MRAAHSVRYNERMAFNDQQIGSRTCMHFRDLVVVVCGECVVEVWLCGVSRRVSTEDCHWQMQLSVQGRSKTRQAGTTFRRRKTRHSLKLPSAEMSAKIRSARLAIMAEMGTKVL